MHSKLNERLHFDFVPLFLRSSFENLNAEDFPLPYHSLYRKVCPSFFRICWSLSPYITIFTFYFEGLLIGLLQLLAGTTPSLSLIGTRPPLSILSWSHACVNFRLARPFVFVSITVGLLSSFSSASGHFYPTHLFPSHSVDLRVLLPWVNIWARVVWLLRVCHLKKKHRFLGCCTINILTSLGTTKSNMR